VKKFEVVLPSRFNATTALGVIDALLDEQRRPKANEVVFDFGELEWITPTGVTCFSNLIEWLMSQGVECQFQDFLPITEVCRYLDDSGFFEIYLGARIISRSQVRNTTVPLKRVRHSESHAFLDLELLPWMMGRLNMNRASLADIQTSIQEIFNNILDHSTQQIGCVYGQHFPHKNIISFAVADFGIGIPAAMARIGSYADDGAAILEASKEGVTSQGSARNMGAGLDILIRNVVGRNRGNLTIRSSHGRLLCRPNYQGVIKTSDAFSGFYPGTLIDIELRTDTIERVEDTREDLEW
tara:strand:- start:1369 stop:2259 length:891 start_codon:yes stop_codon:yes gene_type:complete